MSFVTLSFRIHIPLRLRNYAPLDVEKSHSYFDEEATALQIDELSETCFLPATKLLLKLVKQQKGKFKTAFSISGITMELLEKYRPDVIQLFKKLFKTGCADIYAETYYHSLASMYAQQEFETQIKQHSKKAESLFGIKPSVFRNTELIHDNKLAATVQQLGLKGILCEGVSRLLKENNPNKLYAAPGIENLGLLLRNYRLSDDLAFHFDNENWIEHPLTAAKFASWIHAQTEHADVVNLFLDYATFGTHKKKESGIFQFLEELPQAVANEQWQFETPSNVLSQLSPVHVYDASQPTSWKDKTEACCMWCENMMQNNMLHKIYRMEQLVAKTGNTKMIEVWRRLQCADYFFYMSAVDVTENSNSTNPFCTPEDAYRNYYNIITDFEIQLIRKDIEDFKVKRPLLRALIF
jgi:alpha-amylase